MECPDCPPTEEEWAEFEKFQREEGANWKDSQAEGNSSREAPSEQDIAASEAEAEANGAAGLDFLIDHEPRTNEHNVNAALDDAIGRVNWSNLLLSEPEPIEWLVPGVLTRGGLMTLYSPAGIGKSLLALEWSVNLALGGEIFGQKVPQKRVLYVDLENDQHLIRARLMSLGIKSPDQAAVLDQQLIYSLYGDWPMLDTLQGGMALVKAVEAYGVDVVVIDTTQRVISGRENDSDTFRHLHAFTMRELKKRGVSIIRLDHAGKDAERGTRGSSGKNDDVDLIYKLSHVGGERFRLTREKNRPGLSGEATLNLMRLSDPLIHVLAGSVGVPGSDVAEWSDAVVEAIEVLDDAGVPNDFGREKARGKLQPLAISFSNEVLAQAVKHRKARDGA
ncbi:AAA family ATPase [Tessaracoccus sp. MC1679]|uniref:AAA family ATPase n=1 Tax=Tessaracoccus sp. MC1679 TaxID=2760313 RepID=UPI0016024D8A|nr:AAA family ATPase [Tessaracoccus sp. MC1679]MBB1515010.1 AAA family ATPase [Tessaracoccus sp. MC1679]